MRLLTLIAATGLLVLALFLFFQGEANLRPPSPEAGGEGRGAGGIGAGPRIDRSSPPPKREDLHPAGAAEKQAERVPGPREILVQVVEKEGGHPVPGAEVLRIDKADIPPERYDLFRYGRLDEPGALRPYGTVHLTDDRGEVIVPRAALECVLFAAKGERQAAARLKPDSEEPFRLVLARHDILQVRVVDREGRPRAGVPVALFCETYHRQGSLHLQERMRRVTRGRRGLAGFASPRGLFLRTFCRPAEPADRLFLGFAFPLEEMEVIEVRPGKEEKEPLELVLPPAGRVRVRVLHQDGREPVGPVHVGMRNQMPTRVTAPPGREGILWLRTLTNLGEPGPTFPAVGLGLKLRFYAGLPRKGGFLARRSAVGPTREGEERVIDLVLDREEGKAAEIRGIALDEKGRPLSRRFLVAALNNGPWSWSFKRIATGEDGAFAVRFDNPPEKPNPFTLSLPLPGVARSNRPQVRVTRLFTPEMHDLGRLTLEPQTLLCAGRVVDSRGAPVSGATVGLYAQRMDGGPVREKMLNDTIPGSPGPWLMMPRLRLPVDRRGGFVLRGEHPDLRFLVMAWAEHHSLGRPRPFPRGSRDLRLVLHRQGKVAGSVEGKDLAGTRDLGVEWHPQGGPAREFHWQVRRFAVVKNRFSGELLPGAYTARFLVRKKPFLEIADLEVPPGRTCTDPRLQGIDLGERVQVVRVAFANSELGVGDSRVTISTGGESFKRILGSGRILTLLFLELPAKIDLQVQGYEPLVLAPPAREQRVELRKK